MRLGHVMAGEPRVSSEGGSLATLIAWRIAVAGLLLAAWWTAATLAGPGFVASPDAVARFLGAAVRDGTALVAVGETFQLGLAGLLVTNGTVGAPVREFTIASTLQRMLLDIAEIGGDVDWLPMRSNGMSLVIRDVTMSGA